MTEDDYFYKDSESQIESEIFALIKSITNLNNKYQKGIVNENFFKKALKNAMNNLIKLNFTLKEKNLSFREILKRMNISQEYHSVIEIINHISSLNLPNNELSSKNHSFLELPGITSEITSSFITLLDALTLNGLTKTEIIFTFFDDLIFNLSKFPGLDDLLIKVKDIQKLAKSHIDDLPSNPKFKEDLIDSLYYLFKEFQEKLRVNL
ncbi:MAG: hypothetical protein ACFFEY_04825 [Candidatus Thorarchaeota archaeon]